MFTELVKKVCKSFEKKQSFNQYLSAQETHFGSERK